MAWKEATPLERDKIRRQIVKAYPIESFISGIDVFQNDNTLVDDKLNVWFVDNGASFDFRARGGRKGWFDKRKNPTDSVNGYFSLAHHPSQTTLRTILSGIKDSDLLEAARSYDFEKLAKSLPKDYQTSNLLAYAKALNYYARLDSNGSSQNNKDEHYDSIKNNTTGRKLKDPEQFKKEMLAWVAKASNDALAKYLNEHDDDDLYKDAIKIVVEEANKRSRRENGGWGGETT